MRVGLYFGSFNPIHHGHLIIAQHIINNSHLDQVWLVLSPQNPFKPSKSLLNEYHRLHLAQLAIGEHPQLKVSDIEFHLPKPSYTIDTLTYLTEKYPNHEWTLIMGADGVQNLPRWKNATVLLERYPILVYPRPGHTLDNLPHANLTIVEAPLLDISSTHIRQTLQQKQSIQFLVPDAVRKEIETHHYYK